MASVGELASKLKDMLKDSPQGDQPLVTVLTSVGLTDDLAKAFLEQVGLETNEILAFCQLDLEDLKEVYDMLKDFPGWKISHRGRVKLAHQACIALTADATPTTVAKLDASPASTATGKIHMSQVLNQVLAGEITLLDPEVITAGYATYFKSQGAPPLACEECTAEQLSAFTASIRDLGSTYADFAVWVPFGLRSQKRQKFTGKVFAANGTLIDQEIIGPPTFDDWEKSYRLFRTACLMFNVLSPARCDNYCAKIKAYTRRYPGCWAVIYQVDVRSRLEQAQRVKRNGSTKAAAAMAQGKTHDYDPTMPWEYVFEQLTNKERQWWTTELEEPCIQIVTKAASLNSFIDDDAPIQRPPQPQHNEQRAPKRQNHSQGPSNQNKRRVMFCEGWQNKTCLDKDGQNRCRANPTFVHQCSKCMRNSHGANWPGGCNNEQRSKQHRGKGGKGGKSKGSGKGGKY